MSVRKQLACLECKADVPTSLHALLGSPLGTDLTRDLPIDATEGVSIPAAIAANRYNQNFLIVPI